MPYKNDPTKNTNTESLYNLNYSSEGLSGLTDTLKKEIQYSGMITKWNNILHTRSLIVLALNIVYHSRVTNKIKVYTGVNSYHKNTYYSDVLKLSHKATKSIILALQGLEYLTYIPGGIKIVYRNGVKDRVKFASHIEISDKLLTILEGYIQYERIICSPESLVRVLVSRTPKRYKHYMRDSSRLPSKYIIQTSQRVLYQLNKILSNTNIVVATEKPQFIGCAEKVYNRIYHEHFSKQDKFTNHGRYYAGLISAIKSDDRRHILFDGEPTVEIDIVSSHAMIAYVLNGVDFTRQDNPAYHIDGIFGDKVSHDIDQVIARKIFKQAMLIQFSTRDSHHAASALANWVEEETLWSHIRQITDELKKLRHSSKHKTPVSLSSEYAPYYNASRLIIEVLREKHHPIKNWFRNKDANGKLCFKESEIITDVLKHFTAQSIPSLPVHDSIVIGESHAAELNAVLVDAISKHVGITFAHPEKLTKGFNEIIGCDVLSTLPPNPAEAPVRLYNVPLPIPLTSIPKAI